MCASASRVSARTSTALRPRSSQHRSAATPPNSAKSSRRPTSRWSRAALAVAQIEAARAREWVRGEVGEPRLLHFVGRCDGQLVHEGDVAGRLEVGEALEAMPLY